MSEVETPTDRRKTDPTALTTAALYREITTISTLIRDEISHRAQLTDVQFNAVTDKLRALAERTAEQKADTKSAVDSALQAAKEAVGQQTEASERSIAKSELATTKQIDALGVLLSASVAGTDEKINDLKSRMDRAEAMKSGGVAAVAETRDISSIQRAALTLGISALLLILAIGTFIVAFTRG